LWKNRYQFNTDLYNVDVVVNILLKALAATPLPDFNLCMALLSERTPSSSPEDADTQNDSATLLPILSSLSRHLNECRFPTFWMLYKDDSLVYLRENYTVEVAGFEDAIRDVVVRAVKSTFTKIGVARLGSYLDLQGMPILHSEFTKSNHGLR
jgi:translation initiation factor 3 subunit K